MDKKYAFASATQGEWQDGLTKRKYFNGLAMQKFWSYEEAKAKYKGRKK